MGKGGGNPQYLKSLGKGLRTPEEERAIHVAGGKASQAKMRERRALRALAEELSTTKVSKKRLSEKAKALTDTFGLKGDFTADLTMMMALYAKAMDGDVEAAKFIRGTLGEDPAQMVQVGPIDAAKSDLTQFTDAQLEARRNELLALSDGGGLGDSGDSGGGGGDGDSETPVESEE